MFWLLENKIRSKEIILSSEPL